MTDTIAVVEEAQALDEAYAMGRRRFEDMDIKDPESFTLEHFRDSAQYTNHVLPTLRCMAGFGDSGVGTWQVPREVALIADGDGKDHPADAEITHCSHIFERLVEKWTQGAYAAVEKTAASRRPEA